MNSLDIGQEIDNVSVSVVPPGSNAALNLSFLYVEQ